MRETRLSLAYGSLNFQTRTNERALGSILSETSPRSDLTCTFETPWAPSLLLPQASRPRQPRPTPPRPRSSRPQRHPRMPRCRETFRSKPATSMPRRRATPQRCKPIRTTLGPSSAWRASRSIGTISRRSKPMRVTSQPTIQAIHERSACSQRFPFVAARQRTFAPTRSPEKSTYRSRSSIRYPSSKPRSTASPPRCCSTRAGRGSISRPRSRGRSDSRHTLPAKARSRAASTQRFVRPRSIGSNSAPRRSDRCLFPFSIRFRRVSTGYSGRTCSTTS